jgi:hypothetical protein
MPVNERLELSKTKQNTQSFVQTHFSQQCLEKKFLKLGLLNFTVLDRKSILIMTNLWVIRFNLGLNKNL